MTWKSWQISPCGTHHLDENGLPAYSERFDEVLKFHEPGLAPVIRGKQAWHVRSDGMSAYDRFFLRSFGYYEGLAAVLSPDGWHHIDVDGRDIYTRRHAWCGNFQQGRCTVRDDEGYYFHITTQGENAYTDRWRYAGDYRDGIAAVQASDGRYTHVRFDGSLLHGKWFVDLDVFHKGFARSRDKDGWFHVDIQGRPAYARRFQSVEPFYNGQARVERFDGTLEVIDEAGGQLVELRPALESEFASLSSDMVGFWRTQTIAAAVKIGIIESLPATEREVADCCGLSDDGVCRLLRALGELGLISRCCEQWELTARGELLRFDHPLTLADAAIEYAGPFTAMWEHLSEALQQGNAWSAPDVFGEVAGDDNRRLAHHRMLQSYARHDYAEICQSIDLCGDERVVDAGGGLGVIAQKIIEGCPSALVTVLERPEVVAMAPSDSKVCWQSGSLFESWEIEADVVVLSRVLHDWDDSDVLQILAQARAALTCGGRIYIVEMLVSEESFAGALCDLHLLMVTGGRERTLGHFDRLLSATGFKIADVRRLPSLPSIIVGVAL